ncbi:MAG: hypothetical protein NUV51_10970 [Sulfuricaulis sp.]|nr:hypothetical protein [Sulfuricaulis sp.]
MNSYQFFLKHAGYSYSPETESPMQGRIRVARALAKAERKARDMGISFQWEMDDYLSSEWIDANKDGGRNCDPWHTWYCCARPPIEDADTYGAGEVLASLGGIDFGRDGEPWGDPYRRVVEAELAIEALQRAGL